MHMLFALSAGPDIAVDQGLVMIGRDRRCDARLDSERVSRRHCVLTRAGGEVLVRDLGSTNGTYINGQRVASARLKPGDEMSIAHIRYRLELISSHRSPLASMPASPA
jgi:pSer/pThr/pTyr-binding forkhead associated (FHA) protein